MTKKTTESIRIVTLSFVITGCGGKSATCSFKLMRFAMRYIKGMRRCTPGLQTEWKRPRRSTTMAQASGTIRIVDKNRNKRMIKNRTMNGMIFFLSLCKNQSMDKMETVFLKTAFFRKCSPEATSLSNNSRALSL